MSYHKRAAKYGAKKTTIGGVTFDSKDEAAAFGPISLVAKSRGNTLERNRRNVKLVAGIAMRPDFTEYNRAGAIVAFHEFKGFETPVYKLKKKLWREFGPCKLYVWKGKPATLAETIERDITPLMEGGISFKGKV